MNGFLQRIVVDAHRSAHVTAWNLRAIAAPLSRLPDAVDSVSRLFAGSASPLLILVTSMRGSSPVRSTPFGGESAATPPSRLTNRSPPRTVRTPSLVGSPNGRYARAAAASVA